MIKNFQYDFLSKPLFIPLLLLIFLAAKTIFLFSTTFWFSFLSDIITIPIILSIVRKFIEIQERRNFSQIQLLFGFIIFEILFILFSETSLYILGPTIKSLKGFLVKPTLFIALLSGFFAIVYLFFIAIILSILTILFLSKQSKSIKKYYVVTIIYFILASLGANFEKHYGIEWIKYTFGTLTIIFFIFLTYYNRWVVYLDKKEKGKVIIQCLILLIIIGFALNKSGSKEQLEELISLYSVSVVTAYNLIFGMALSYSILLPILTLFQLPTTEVIQKKTTEIETLQELSQMISKVLDINKLTEHIIQTITRISKTENVILCIFESNSNCSHYKSKEFTNQELELIKLFFERNFTSSGEPLIFNSNIDWFKHSSFKELTLIIYLPLLHNGKLFGYIFVGIDNPEQFEREDLKTLKSISQYASIAIQNSKLLKESIEKEKLEKEIEVAREIQQGLFPKAFPESIIFEFYGTNKPSKQIGGDYFDVFRINENQILILIADVVGKGIPASLVMSNLQAMVKTLTRVNFDLRTSTKELNNLMKQNLQPGNFITLFWGILDERNKTLEYVNAGHNPPILIRKSGIKRLDKGGILLGVIELNQNYDSEIIELSEGDLLCLFTDGFIEAVDKNENEFGENRFIEMLTAYRNFPLRQIANKLIDEVITFSIDTIVMDDLTLLIVKVK